MAVRWVGHAACTRVVKMYTKIKSGREHLRNLVADGKIKLGQILRTQDLHLFYVA